MRGHGRSTARRATMAVGVVAGLVLTSLAPAGASPARTGGSSGLGAAAATTQVPGAPTVTTTVLPALPGTPASEETRPRDVNNRGQVVGYSGDRAVLWDSGEPVALPVTREFFPHFAQEINDRGEVLVDVDNHPYRWLDGEVTSLGLPEYGTAKVMDLNEAGQALLLGSLYPGVAVWEAGTYTMLPEPAEDQLMGVADLSEAGHVLGNVGWSIDFLFVPGPSFLWHDGSMTWFDASEVGAAVNRSGQAVTRRLSLTGPSTGTLHDGGRTTHLDFDPRDINDRGQVVGTTGILGGRGRAVLWEDGRLTQLGTLGGATSQATGINERGQVVGISAAADGRAHSFVWTSGRMIDLGPANPDVSDNWPVEITDEGYIAGQVATDDGVQAVLWEVDDDGSGDPGDPPGGECLSATNSAHVAAGRATAWLVFAWAAGSGQYLGLTSQTTAVRLTAPGRWERVERC